MVGPMKGGRNLNSRLFSFIGGSVGPWKVKRIEAVSGEALANVERIEIVAGAGANGLPERDAAAWVLRGVTSNDRYVTRAEKDQLVARQPSIGRPEATCAALIPIRKSAQWWAMTQDERREIVEERSRHIETGLRYLPAVARRLHHCRDLGHDLLEGEPFDFLTWFEFAPEDERAFDELVAALRMTEEWKYVEREVEVRVARG